MFERAAQVNARFAANTCHPREVVAALEELGLTTDQITVLERPTPAAPPAASGWGGRLRGVFGTRPAATPAPAAAPDLQITVHLGQDDALSEAVRAVFRRFGAAGIEHFDASHSANRAFGPGGPPPAATEPE